MWLAVVFVSLALLFGAGAASERPRIDPKILVLLTVLAVLLAAAVVVG